VDGGAAGTTVFPAATVSGTRLRARTWVAADGTRVLDTTDDTARGQIWYDTALETPCTFQGPDDGTLRCVPLTPFADPQSLFGPFTLGFLGASCQGERVAAGPYGWSSPASAALREASCGGKRYATLINETSVDPDIFEVGAPLDGATAIFSRPYDTPDECGPPKADAPNHYYRLGRRVERGQLVQAHIQVVRTGKRMAFRSIVGADGTQQRIGWYDTSLDVDCTVGEAGDGNTRCLPRADSVPFLGVYGDAGCRMPVTFQAGGAAFAVATSSEGGLKARTYYRVGPPSAKIYFQSGTDCTSFDSDTSSFRTLTEVPFTTFEAFPEVTAAHARLKVTVHADADGAVEAFPLSPGPFPNAVTDAKTSEPCVFAPASDGKLRCLPDSTAVRYTTPACAAAPGTGVVTLSFLGDRRPKHAAVWSGDACTGGFALSELGRRQGPQLGDLWDTTFYGDACLLTPFHDENLDAYSIGPAESAAGFVDAALVTE
jgi:hypothetical protein